MTDHWYHCPNLQVGANELPPDEAHHALRVLRVRDGDSLTIFDGEGKVASGTARTDIESKNSRAKNAKSLTIEVAEIVEPEPPNPELTIITAACKGPRMSWLVEKCTELGVVRIIVTEFERSVVRVNDNTIQKLQRTALEACKQSRRPIVPQVISTPNGIGCVREWAAKYSNAAFFAHPTPNARKLADAARDLPIEKPVTIAIGPEGGFTDNEVKAMQECGAEPVSLAPNILRVETAAVCAASVVMCRD